ncbi:hypothetical protein KUTeg_006218 [Tegillarca granosa]|uniref:EGF-like domain-containing protein n=1 Tax=Tegillarca granosa TaxID=220873 RepID=A0ABQ9FFZ2_TEGGR|nr:hypothetical protein KUTeg_006218 [Tegillarca granosa]
MNYKLLTNLASFQDEGIKGCQVGRYGPLCQYVCNGNCLHQECNQTTGKCNRCHERFGFDCSHPCSDKCHERQCVQDSGKCNSCKTGYYGFNCTKQCSGCLNGSCYQDTGVCQHQSRCRQGFYGTRGSEVMCNHICNRNCKTCDKSNGTCKECDDGFYGQSCENSCPSHCINNLCIKENGSCKNGCQKTFYGDQCNNNCSESCKFQDCFRNGTCRDCVPGTYGNLCEQKCPKGCMNGNCSRNGSCIDACFNGYYGEACDKMCSENCSAKGFDKYISYCHECKIGWYGLRCSEQCPFNCSSNTCNKTTGTCTNCVKGYHGLYCNETCSNGCKDAICDQMSGNCSHGCADGFLGQFCQKLVESDTNTVLVMSVSAVIISTIIIVFVARMVAFVYKRKKSRTSRERSMKLNVLVDKTSEVSNLKNALAETTNGKRNKKCATPGGAKIDIYEKLIMSVENKSTNATVSACYEKLTDAVYSDIEFYGIIVENFEREIMQKKMENLFDLEYKKFQHDVVFPCTIAALPENRLLNRRSF